MSLRIRFRGDVLAGRVFSFGDDVERIVIGRDPERSDVVLPSDMTQVGREHLALERVLARYRLVLNTENPVFVDDVLAHNGQELPEVAHVQLGEDGPRLVVQTTGVTTVPPTEHHGEGAPDLHDVVARAARRMRGTRRGVVLVLFGLALLAGAIVWVDHSTGRKVASVTEEQVRVRGFLDRTSGDLANLIEHHRETTSDLRGRLSHVDETLEEITPDLSGLRKAVSGLGPRMKGLEERLRQKGPRIKRWLTAAGASVYVVVLRDERGVEHALATAWVVGDGSLATNGHVAQFFERVSPGGDLEGATLLVRSPGGVPHDHRVTGVRIHPGYDVFLKLWKEYQPTGMSPEGRLHFLRPAGGACDVALLEVDDAEALATPLEIAPYSSLEILGAGDVVGLVGYPSEEMSLGGVNLRHPTPTTQIAHVTAVTNFFLAATDAEDALLVQHSLPVTGGASGSPILDEDGKVVAVLSAGNIELSPLGNRAPSAVLVNFAQRADLVQELIEGEAEEAQAPRSKRWQEGIATLMSLQSAAEKGALGFLERYLDVVEKDVGTEPERLETWDGPLDASAPRQPWKAIHDVAWEIPEKGLYVFFAYGVLGQDVDLAVLHETDDTVVYGEEASRDWYSAVRITADGQAKVRLRVSGPRDAEFWLSAYRFPP